MSLNPMIFDYLITVFDRELNVVHPSQGLLKRFTGASLILPSFRNILREISGNK